MPRPRGSTKPPSYCQHKASGLAYVTLDGREIYLGRHGTPESRNLYDRVVGEWLAAGRTTSASEPSPCFTVTTLIAHFWEHAKKEYGGCDLQDGKRPSGELGNYWDILKVLKRLYGPMPADKFGPLALQALREEMMKPRVRTSKAGETIVKAGWCRNVINRQISRVKAVFAFGVAQQLLSPSVHHALQAVKGLKRGRTAARETDRVKPVAQEHVDAVLPWVSRQVRAMIQLQLLTGARPGELCAMRVRDVQAVGALWTYRPEKHKNAHHDHERVIRFGARAQVILRQFTRTDSRDAFLFSPAEAEAERLREKREARVTRITPSQQRRSFNSRRRRRARAPGCCYSPASYRRAVARACDVADAWAKGGMVIGNDQRVVPRWHPHQLRHNAATKWRKEYGPEQALTLLGDRTTRMIDVYAERDHAAADEIMARIG